MDLDSPEAPSVAAELRPRDSLRPQTIPDQLAERIYRLIASGEFKPGDRIREEDMSARFDVSRGPVREALRILEKDGVISMIPNRGAHVTRLAVKEVNDIFEIRKALHGLMVRKFISVDEALIAAMDRDVSELERLSEMPEKVTEYVRISARLSMSIAARSDNTKLAEMIRSLARQTMRYTQLGLADPTRRLESAKNWRRVANALKAGDFDEAGAASDQLIEDSRHEAVKQLEATNAMSDKPKTAT
ncbi:GntR family transcriptional regulator [Paraburkholderia sp. BL10I2N1]|uniref:GntR family transcriptional regulator n=2 Tax=Paraburkholderia sp. BL10I2N1 TaxID=1938796 RepID=UPI0014152606|nr:GntR family transcriptional regulator [Paraburkholderia sp. BL10I2N1]